MEDKKEFFPFLKAVSDGLKILSPEELSEAISDFHLKKTASPKNIQTLINVVCREYQVSRDSINEKYTRGSVYHAKVVIYNILKESFGWSNRKIAHEFDVYYNAVNVAINFKKDLNIDRIASDREFLDKYNHCLSIFLEQIAE